LQAPTLNERRIRTEPERFSVVLGIRSHARIVIEASTDSELVVARCLAALGQEVIVADPNFSPMYATLTRKVKTDRCDTRAPAEARYRVPSGTAVSLLAIASSLVFRPRSHVNEHAGELCG
jgi:transposase